MNLLKIPVIIEAFIDIDYYKYPLILLNIITELIFD